MKTESTFAFVLRVAVTLLLICGVVALALAGVNAITEDRIADLKEASTQAAIAAVLPGGGKEVSFTDDTGLVTKVFASDAGYAVQVTPSGFNAAIDMMVGVSKDGKVLGISIISCTDTPGLGATVAAENSAGEAFRSQFVGMSGNLAVTKDGGSVDAVTSATISSRAVTSGVNAALACAAKLG